MQNVSGQTFKESDVTIFSYPTPPTKSIKRPADAIQDPGYSIRKNDPITEPIADWEVVDRTGNFLPNTQEDRMNILADR